MNDYRTIMTAIYVVCVLACASAVWAVVDAVMTVVVSLLIGGGLVLVAVAAIRRELRIRRRLAEIQPRPVSAKEVVR